RGLGDRIGAGLAGDVGATRAIGPGLGQSRLARTLEGGDLDATFGGDHGLGLAVVAAARSASAWSVALGWPAALGVFGLVVRGRRVFGGHVSYLEEG
ncbi:MAG TPA: hypothetical protein VMT87_16995, partial [Vicinamibacteria bacterium]|nr:hypothetical protein [Vicinamibacteria bacterium]